MERQGDLERHFLAQNPLEEPPSTFTKRDEIYRRNAKKKALKFLIKKRRKTATRQQDPPLDAETIQYAEPYRDTFTRRDSIYRKKAKKKCP